MTSNQFNYILAPPPANLQNNTCLLVNNKFPTYTQKSKWVQWGLFPGKGSKGSQGQACQRCPVYLDLQYSNKPSRWHLYLQINPLNPIHSSQGRRVWTAARFSLTVSLRCSGKRSLSCAMHSLILSRLFFSISLWGNL